MPLFVEDFIKHIYEEEDILFSYILTLQNFSLKTKNIFPVYQMMEKNVLSDIAERHHLEEDEMHGLREITSNYNVDKAESLLMKVIFNELKCLEDDLKIHAMIENDVLFPKALKLEKKAKTIIKNKIQLN
jgi:regulator of cell morphogenesis and NO signaling